MLQIDLFLLSQLKENKKLDIYLKIKEKERKPENASSLAKRNKSNVEFLLNDEFLSY